MGAWALLRSVLLLIRICDPGIEMGVRKEVFGGSMHSAVLGYVMNGVTCSEIRHWNELWGFKGADMYRAE